MRTELYWIDGPWRGRLAIMPRPRGGDWLEHEVSAWQRIGIGLIVSALTMEETAELDLSREQELCEKTGIAFIAFPIADRGLPPSMKAVLDLARRLEQCLAQGGKGAIHCRQGVGRSALLAACILAASGVDPASAWELIAAARGCSVPDTSEQREWVVRFARDMLAPLFSGELPTRSAAKSMRSGGER
jgi:protein-tyrosine phosphatase